MKSILTTPRLLLLCIVCGILFSVAAVAADEPPADVLTAKQILDRMAEVYANCKSYRDSGELKMQIEGQAKEEKFLFTTAFVRPDRFRLEVKGKRGRQDYRFLVWRKDKEVQTWWSLVPGWKIETLSLAVAGATGVSGGAAHTIPALILPKEIEGWRLTEMTEARRIEDAKLGKADCFRITGKFDVAQLNAHDQLTVWMDKKTFLVRRIDQSSHSEDIRMERTTLYDPVIDGDVPDKMLLFDPPGKK